MSLPLPRQPFFILGPCVIESEEHSLSTAATIADIAERLKIKVYFKSSFDKANRSSGKSFRGLGLDEGLRILDKVRTATGLPILTDVHTPEEARSAGDVVDFLQTPAMLCRQTDLIAAVGEVSAKKNKPINLKKGQFLSPHEMKNVGDKAMAMGTARDHVYLCERGFSFGYNNLVVDMRSLAIMRGLGYGVVFDATHSVQLPGGAGDKSSGQREFVPVLARAAIAVGIDGLFMETHPNPEQALSDGPNAWPLQQLEGLIKHLLELHQVTAKCSH